MGTCVYRVKIYKIYKIRKIKLLRLRPLQISVVKFWAKIFLMLFFEFLVSKICRKTIWMKNKKYQKNIWMSIRRDI